MEDSYLLEEAWNEVLSHHTLVCVLGVREYLAKMRFHGMKTWIHHLEGIKTQER